MYRTHTCGELTARNISEKVTLCGWVKRRRDHGGLIFIDLRDQYGVTQVVFNPEIEHSSFEQAKTLRNEFVIQISGCVEQRPDNSENEGLTTGEIEVNVQPLEILNNAKTTSSERVLSEKITLLLLSLISLKSIAYFHFLNSYYEFNLYS